MLLVRTAALTAIAGTLLMYTSACCCCMGPPVSEEDRARMQQEREQAAKAREEQEAAERAAKEAAERAKWASLPDTERKFCEALQTAAVAYRSADNDLKKSKVRRDRAAAIRAAVPGGKVSGWSGKVDTLTTTGQGNVVLVVRLPCDDFTVGTWNNEMSDIMDNTLISATSGVYDTLAEMKVGDGLTFNGRLLADDLNGFKGTSMTELGSMSGEAFLLRF